MVLLFVFGLLDDKGKLSYYTRKIFVLSTFGQVSRSKTAIYIKSSFSFVSEENTSYRVFIVVASCVVNKRS